MLCDNGLLTACELSLTKTGQGAKIEAFRCCTVPSITVSGRSEDLLLDKGMHEALKLHRQMARQTHERVYSIPNL